MINDNLGSDSLTYFVVMISQTNPIEKLKVFMDTTLKK